MDKPPQIDPALVQQFVGAGHGDLDMTSNLLDKEPGLINAAWDWGGGDWETALGGAAHMGRADIAKFLLSRGARLDLFAAAMLGMIDVVKAAIEADRGVVSVAGPHGISLMQHAEAGKRQSVIALLQEATKSETN